MTAQQDNGSLNPGRGIMIAAIIGILTFVGIPTNAKASGGSVHIDLPGLSIGFHDDHYKKKRYRKQYRDRRSYRDRGYYRDRGHYRGRHYYNERRAHRRDHRRHDRYYNNRRYNDRYYYSGRSDRRDRNRYYQGRSQICPVAGYSPYYDRGLNCYRHKGHYHCS